MPSTFPGAIDSFTDPLSNSPLNSPSHSTLHSDINDAVEKVEQYMGLVKVIPTSVSSAGGTAATLNSTTGTITIGTSNTSVTVNGAFSSLYDNYRIVIGGGVGSANITLSLQLGGSTTGYYSIVNYADYATATTPKSAGDNNSSQWTYVGYAGSNYSQASFDVIGPNLARFTIYNNASWAATTVAGTSSGTHQVATAYTSFTLGVNTGNISGGSIRVYGYRN